MSLQTWWRGLFSRSYHIVVSQLNPQTLKEEYMKFKSLLDDVGSGVKKFFTRDLSVVTTAAKDVEPFIDIAFPGISTLYNLTVTAVATTEAAAASAGVQSGSGPQKLAAVVSTIEADFNTYAKAAGITINTSTIEAWVNAVVASLNAIPTAPTAAAAVADVPAVLKAVSATEVAVEDSMVHPAVGAPPAQ